MLIIFYLQHSMYAPLVISFLFKSCNFMKGSVEHCLALIKKVNKMLFFNEDIILGVEESLDKKTGYILSLVLFSTYRRIFEQSA